MINIQLTKTDAERIALALRTVALDCAKAAIMCELEAVSLGQAYEADYKRLLELADRFESAENTR